MFWETDTVVFKEVQNKINVFVPAKSKTQIFNLLQHSKSVPNSDFLNFTSSEKIDKIEIYDLMGKLVLKTSETNNPIAINHLTKGVYLLNVFSGERKQVRKLIVE